MAEMANQEHLDILARGVEKWNAWRVEHSGLRALATFSVIARAPDTRPAGGNKPAQTGESKDAAAASGEEHPGAAASAAGKTSRNFVYVFDDLHIRFADMARVRAAARDGRIGVTEYPEHRNYAESAARSEVGPST